MIHQCHNIIKQLYFIPGYFYRICHRFSPLSRNTIEFPTVLILSSETNHGWLAATAERFSTCSVKMMMVMVMVLGSGCGYSIEVSV
jgi:hypothetical protein